MVLQKRLDYGFNGYQVPAMPRALRSARRRRIFKKKADDCEMCAFELLAAVAGELLQHTECSLAPSRMLSGGKDGTKQEHQDEEHCFKQEPCDQGSCDESASGFTLGQKRNGPDYLAKEHLQSKVVSTLGLTSELIKPEKLDNAFRAEESVIAETSKSYGNYPCMIRGTCVLDRGSPGSAESHGGKVEDGISRQLEEEQQIIGSIRNVDVPDILPLEDPTEISNKPPSPVSSDSSIEVPFNGTNNHCRPFIRLQDDVKVGSRDDDENSSGCTQPSTPTLKSFYLPCVGDRKIKKLLASKYWKSAPAVLKDGDLPNLEMDTKPAFGSQKMCYTQQRTLGFSSKRRKLSEGSLMKFHRGVCSENFSSSFDKAISGEATGLSGAMHRGSSVSSPVMGHKSTMEPKDSHVKIRIKSFQVPELFIEIPETATVGSLKRTVLDAVIAKLGGRLRVGVLLHGKKVRDDDRTLLQTGISHDGKLDSLGFTLEPTSVHPLPGPPPPRGLEDGPYLLPGDPSLLITRYTPVPASDPRVSKALPESPKTTPGDFTESNHVPIPFSTDISLDNGAQDSKALVAIPAMSVEALAVVPLHRKSRRTEFVQRRIRRPFSVVEVEALVQAVEKLGTGRWRDVKLRAFENAKHRTYVDLKDKWKTLVHTARISPQQRRGEPVPQVLLDRVLSAHAYWSQHQTKHHHKQQRQLQLQEPCLLH